MIPNELSRAGSLVHFVEQVLDTADVGICLDVGHAHIDSAWLWPQRETIRKSSRTFANVTVPLAGV